MDKVLLQLILLVQIDLEKSLFWGLIKNFFDVVFVVDCECIVVVMCLLLLIWVLFVYGCLLRFVCDEYIFKVCVSMVWLVLLDGKVWYVYCVQQLMMLLLMFDQIYEIGLKEVVCILGEMEMVCQQVGFEGDFKVFFKYLQDDFKFYFIKFVDLLVGYCVLQKKINGLMFKFFDIVFKVDYEVCEVEVFCVESVVGGLYEQFVVDGLCLGVFYVNIFNFKVQFIFGMEMLFLYEVLLGYYFQIFIVQEDMMLLVFCCYGSYYIVYVEGWVLYVESLGKELGFFIDFYQWYGCFFDEQLCVMCLVVDIGLYVKGWMCEWVIQYMLDNFFMVESDIVFEVECYIVWFGQVLGYKIGQLEIIKLCCEVEEVLGLKFDIKGFYCLVLILGQVFLLVLCGLVMDWVVQCKVG